MLFLLLQYLFFYKTTHAILMSGHEETRMSEDTYFQYNEYYHGWMTRADYNYVICVISKQQDSVYVLANAFQAGG